MSAEQQMTPRLVMSLALLTLEKRLNALLTFVEQWDRAEARHGCYDYFPVHHPRCERERSGATAETPCTCGRDELEEARAKVRLAFAE